MRSKDSFVTQIKACLYMLISARFINPLVEVDYKKELMRNSGLAQASHEQKEKYKSKLLSDTVDRAKLLRKRLVISLAWVTTACAIPVILFMIFFTHWLLSKITASNILAITSISFFAWATLGRLGWKGQTFGGDTVFEQLDKNIFWIQYWFGTFLATLAFLT